MSQFRSRKNKNKSTIATKIPMFIDDGRRKLRREMVFDTNTEAIKYRNWIENKGGDAKIKTYTIQQMSMFGTKTGKMKIYAVFVGRNDSVWRREAKEKYYAKKYRKGR